jgi:hypothetical protein
MNLLETAIKGQEALVLQRSLEITQALNAKRYANKYNGELMTKLRKEIEDAQVRYSLACTDLMKLYTFANAEKVGA